MNEDNRRAAADAGEDPLDQMLRAAAWPETDPERVERLRRSWQSLSPAPKRPGRFPPPTVWIGVAAGLLASLVLWRPAPREETPVESALPKTAVAERPSPDVVEQPPAEAPKEIPPQDPPEDPPGEPSLAPAPPPVAPDETPALETAAVPPAAAPDGISEDPGDLVPEESPGAPGIALAESCEELVLEALRSEMAGDVERRDELLQLALAADPEYPPARWHSGYVSMDGEWLSLDDVHQRSINDRRLQKYRELRVTHANNPMGELALARFCRKEGLEVEARIHWLGVLRFQPNHKEALKNLGMRWYEGYLLTPAQIEEKEARAREANRKKAKRPSRQERTRDQIRDWEPLVTEWQRAVEEGRPDVAESIREELLAVEHLGELQVLDSILYERFGSKKKAETLATLSHHLIDVLGGIPGMGPAESLARHAVYHPIPEVRTAAADALKERPMGGYVRCLLSWMRVPVEASYSIIVLPTGGVSYQHSFYREGVHADSLDVRHDNSNIKFDRFLPNDGTIPRWAPRVAARAARQSAQSQAEAVRKAAAVQQRVEAANARIIALNQRIQAVLSRATGVDLGADPVDWHEWWDDRYYDYYELENPHRDSEGRKEKPVYENRSYRSKTRLISYAQSCFPRGTKVWTLTGPVAIEEIRRGDRVLSQDPESGELAYKPVLQTTTRDPSPMIKVDLGSETIAATRGHPFWVTGEGWRMAKQLQAGSRLHGISGAVEIDGVEEVPADEASFLYGYAFNLIVDDFRTYFVGENRVLVHDNQLFVHDQTSAPLPGLPEA